ncbi:Uncharacterized conserved protein YibQ, putative polysaccharide deacetylase 2 family [Monaibacterium marinum]|uniref:Uncharacterized conserved protein YibQ, putative polysaccharide deacetylase 2 family n=1 Tax=Pontivivens marinum TaxID=1690039 RepID=A0A2C9CQX3_9RHOB|nr:divergent polysaccharide deacetylase family protein [Monaibacterium marinum]SOH93617.1 Uncharacterized conserved protein YibQ, putative polysaccharide deacetylase 2 family [Monaibacterium marinum]
MAQRQGGAGFITGFAGGLVLSAGAFVASAVLIPPAAVEPVPVAEEIPVPPRLPSITEPTNTGPETQQTQAVRPNTSEPQVPTSAPAVDPAINQGGVALAPAPAINLEEQSGAPIARAPSSGFTAPQSSGGLGSPSVETASLSAGATAPARPRAGIGAPAGGAGLEAAVLAPSAAPTATLPSMNTDGSLARPRVTAIQPEAAPQSVDTAPEASTPPPPPPSIPAVTPVSESVVPEQAPRRIYAADFEVTTDQPLISVILVDSGAEAFPQATIDALSLPLTIAIPADARDAVERSAAFRRAGFEVLAMIPADIAVQMGSMTEQQITETLAGVFAAVPEAVGVIDAEGGAMSSSSTVTRTALEYLALTGHVIVTQAGQGFNQSDRLAAAEGVPSAMVERRLNSTFGGGAMVNGLQRVALDARSRGGAILIGQSDAETITSILTWAFSPSSRAVSLAPVTPLLERFEDSR